MAYCRDVFTLTVTGAAIDASITVPGIFPITVLPGANYNIGFNYTVGSPPATAAFEAAWHTSGGTGTPTHQILPAAPVTDVMPTAVQNGTIAGVVPDDVAADSETPILYTCTLTLIQPDS